MATVATDHAYAQAGPVRHRAGLSPSVTYSRRVVGDAQLLAAIAGGDREAFTTLFQRYGRAVLAAVTRIVDSRADAEDVTQDAFATIWRQAAAFDARRGDASAWIHTIARNRARDLLRRRRPISDGPLPELVSADRVDDQVIRDLEAFRVHRALADLEADLRAPLELAYVDGLSQSEIAERLGQPIGTVKTRTRRGLERLREALTASDQVAR